MDGWQESGTWFKSPSRHVPPLWRSPWPCLLGVGLPRSAHLSMLNIRLSDERRPSQRLTGFTRRPCWCEAHWGVLAGGQALPLPNRRNRKSVSREPWSQLPELPSLEPVLASHLIAHLGRTPLSRPGLQGHGCDLLFSPLPSAGCVSSSWQHGWGKNICSYISQVTAVSADGCFLRTCRYVPPCSCQQIRSQGIPCHSCPPSPVLESSGMEWSV